jgi:hypothetical protein
MDFPLDQSSISNLIFSFHFHVFSMKNFHKQELSKLVLNLSDDLIFQVRTIEKNICSYIIQKTDCLN